MSFVGKSLPLRIIDKNKIGKSAKKEIRKFQYKAEKQTNKPYQWFLGNLGGGGGGGGR